MTGRETRTTELRGRYRDVVRGADGRVLRKGEVRSNAIVADCRRILACLLKQDAATGVQGLAVGAGLLKWDKAGAPPATPKQRALVDPAPFLIPAADLSIEFIERGKVTRTPTNELQITAKLGPGSPPWPDARHPSRSLREFGLMGELRGKPALINHVTHPVVHLDRGCTLERTVWLVF